MNSTSHYIPSKYEKHTIRQEFNNFILTENHPCLMAQSVFNGGQFDFHIYSDLGTKETTARLLFDLQQYLEHYDEGSGLVYSFIAVFSKKVSYSEEEFELMLWRQLQYLHEADEQPWDPEVSQDPEDSNFSFSLGGKAFYIVGLHPNSSRKARQSPYPAMVFNLHLQFSELREKGRYKKIQQRIRKRDLALQGTLNPMLQDFSEDSEAKQYSGREVGKDWKCPFLHKNKKNVPAEEIPEKG